MVAASKSSVPMFTCANGRVSLTSTFWLPLTVIVSFLKKASQMSLLEYTFVYVILTV